MNESNAYGHNTIQLPLDETSLNPAQACGSSGGIPSKGARRERCRWSHQHGRVATLQRLLCPFRPLQAPAFERARELVQNVMPAGSVAGEDDRRIVTLSDG